MVAYSFHPQFVPTIQAGYKRQTIRQPRKHHARPGERLQLFQGMRTKYCYKIIPDPLCMMVEPVRIGFAADAGIDRIAVDGVPVDDLEEFAILDGFASLADMALFWRRYHGLHAGRDFEGVVLRWIPVAGEACVS